MELKELVLKELNDGNVVIRDMEGLHSIKLELIINQPSSGILYDLNRDEGTILTFIDDPKWVNDFACAQVIRYLKDKLDKCNE